MRAGRVALVFLLSAARVARGDDPPVKDAKAADEVRIVADMTERVTAWIKARQGLLRKPCWNCDGTGVIRSSVVQTPSGVSAPPIKCSSCDGSGWAISRAAVERVYGKFRSAAARGAPIGAPLPLTDPAHLSLDGGKLDHIEVVDATHAIAWVYEGPASPRGWYWILLPKVRWTLWEGEGVDGPWPAPLKGDAVRAKRDAASEPVPELQSIAIDSALSKLTLWGTVSGKRRASGALLLTIDEPIAASETDRRAASDAVAVMRPLFAMQDEWKSVTVTVRAWWQDKIGARDLAPAWVGTMDRETASKVHWDNLSSAGVFKLITWEAVERAGWEIVEK